MSAHLKAVHLTLTFAWALCMPLALITGWVYSIAFVSVISIYANFAGHFSSWQAARVEVKQDEQNGG